MRINAKKFEEKKRPKKLYNKHYFHFSRYGLEEDEKEEKSFCIRTGV